MKYEIAYKHWGMGCGVFKKEFSTDKEFRIWLNKKFPADESRYKLIGIK